MNITMFHDLDTGFMAATLKPAFKKLGHTCTVIQTLLTHLEKDGSHVDHLMCEMTDQDIHALKNIYKETDLFILRTVSDFTLRTSGILPYITKDNTIWRIHGSELRERNVPYSLYTWRINWYNKEPAVVGPRDPSLIPLYRGNTITQIERPCAFDTFPPRRRNKKEPFVLHTPTRPEKKGTHELMERFRLNKGSIPLRILSGVSREECLTWKAQASYFIDCLGSYEHGPYGMNSVEAWYYKIPVFSQYNNMDVVVCPELPDLVHYVEEHFVQHNILHYEPDKKQLNNARTYALRTHDPVTIADQYTKVIEQ